MSNLPPCKGCAEREPGCHSICIGYLEFKEKQAKILQSRRQYNEYIGNITTSVCRNKK